MEPPNVVVLISASTEWRIVRDMMPDYVIEQTPYGETFLDVITVGNEQRPVIYMHGGFGKVSAAASAQYAIDRWHPDLIVNLGTCGGFDGAIERDAVILVTRALVYDIIEQMGDQQATIDYYTTDINVSWLRQPYPFTVQPGLLVSGDRDLVPEDIPMLKSQYGAVAGDWETASIAWVCAKNNVRSLILRGVSDLVGAQGGEAYDGTVEFFHMRATIVMKRLVRHLGSWLACVDGL